MSRKRLLLSGVTLFVVASTAAGYMAGRARAAGIPASASMTFGGVLTDDAGTPLTGSKNIRLVVWDAATGGTEQCSTTAAAQTLSAGAFQVVLPDACVTAARAKADLWVDVSVDGASIGRTKLGAVPYAVEAEHAVSATNATNATTAQTAATLAAGPVAGALQVFTVYPSDLPPSCQRVDVAIIDCSCPAGTFVVSGGADAGYRTAHFVRESRATSPTTWRVACATGADDVDCASYSLVCSRIGPNN